MIPNVLRSPASPPLPASPGVVVVVDPNREPRAPLVVHGSFHLPMADGDAIGHPVHRGIVLVVWSLGYHYAVAPFREHVLFADDEVGLPGGVGGYFSVDLFELQEGVTPGEFYLFASVGTLVSNVARASVR